MATTRIWAVKNRLDHMVDYVSNQEKTIDIKQVIDYATNDLKTYEKEYVSCINCSYLDPYHSMVNTKKQFNDEICREHNLSVVEKKKHHSKNKNQYYADKTYKSLVKEDVDEALKVSYTMKQFTNEMQLVGYEIKITDNNISVKHACFNKFIRLKSLGNNYTNDAIVDRILDMNKEEPLYSTYYDKKNFDIKPYFTKYQNKQLTGLQRLFLHYQYVLGILPKDKRKTIKYSEELKKAMKHIDEISEQTIFICEKNISDINGLNQYKFDAEKTLNELIKQRQSLRNKVRRCSGEHQLINYKKEITSITKQVKSLRKEIRVCERIEEGLERIMLFEKGRNIKKYKIVIR